MKELINTIQELNEEFTDERWIRVQIDLPESIAIALEQFKVLKHQPKKITVANALRLFFSLLSQRP